MADIAVRLAKWSNWHAALMMFAVFWASLSHSYAPMVLVGSASFALLIFSHRQQLSNYRPFGGIANWLTLSRVVIVMVAMSGYQQLGMSTFFLLMILSVILDVADGYSARKTNTQSEFGRIFDMESDAFFVMSMGLYFLFTTNIGFWLLVPGLLRYVYQLAIWLIPANDYQESKKSYAAIFAGINFIILLAAILLTGVWQEILLLSSILLVVFSFTVSFYEYFRHVKHS